MSLATKFYHDQLNLMQTSNYVAGYIGTDEWNWIRWKNALEQHAGVEWCWSPECLAAEERKGGTNLQLLQVSKQKVGSYVASKQYPISFWIVDLPYLDLEGEVILALHSLIENLHSWQIAFPSCGKLESGLYRKSKLIIGLREELWIAQNWITALGVDFVVPRCCAEESIAALLPNCLPPCPGTFALQLIDRVVGQ